MRSAAREPATGRRRRIAFGAALVLLAASKGVALSLLVPPFHGPDEPLHFDYAQALAENRALPTAAATCRAPVPMYSDEVRAAVIALVNGVAFHPEIRVPTPSSLHLPGGPAARKTSGCGPASIYPPVWYVTAAVAYRAAVTRPLMQRLLAVRWTSVAWSCLAAIAVFAAGSFAFGRLRDAMMYALVVVLQPMTGAISAAANSEAAALAFMGAAIACIAALSRRKGEQWLLPGLALALTLGVLSKPDVLLALPTLAGLALLARMSHDPLPPGSDGAEGDEARSTRARAIAEIAGVFAFPCAAFLAFALSGGERSGLYDEILASGSVLAQLRAHVLSPRRFFDVWVEQYWGKLGWMDTQLGHGWYAVLLAASIALVAGAVIVPRRRGPGRALLAVIASGTLTFAVALYALAYRRGDLQWVQGRHMLVLFPVHAYLLVRGGIELRSRLARRARSRAARLFDPTALLVALLAATNVALGAVALRRFYGPEHGSFAAWQEAWGTSLLLPCAGLSALGTLCLVAWNLGPVRRHRND